MPEPHEIQEFSEHLREANEGGGGSIRSISLAISVLAVLVAMVTVLGHRTHTEAVLMEARASDTWNEYQAKKIRMDNLQVTTDILALQPSGDPARVKSKIDEYNAHIAKWKSDLAEEQQQAREYEAEVSSAEKKAARYDLGEALLQIAVVLSSITLFTRNRTYFVLGIALGATGLLVASSALLVH
ncbi:DUF4337 domain-containing protein [Edaphobacter bradus]|uniref:DUF4337 domain-containing protein n=1 Tax=Edaphobacter bradus TaxID=2259016 RepID=UPI0021DF6345|nr:DUF4337 domain-containing protein [Edaphobacter bradus]